MTSWIYVLSALLLCLAPLRASAHAVSNSYLELNQTAERISGRWRVAVTDLDAAIELDQDGDRRVGDDEVAERRGVIESYLLSRLELSGREGMCPLVVSALTSSGSHVLLDLVSDCAEPRTVRYDLFFEHDRSHQAYLHVTGDSELDHVFTSSERTVPLSAGSAGAAFVQYVGQGFHHILIGADHILFLLTLLVAAVLRREAGRYEPVDGFVGAVAGVAKLVTAFTLAHSITLTLMALDIVVLPARWVETAIASSIVAAAINNLWPFVSRRLWAVAFAFGLIHGLGFAGVLLDLGLPRRQLFAALLGFNLGVEVGQLAIVGLCFPLAFWLRRRPGYPRYALGVGSALAGAIGLVWSLERALERDWSTQLWSLAAGRSASLERRPAARPCPVLPALNDAFLRDALMTAPNEDARTLAGRRAYELACTGQLESAAQTFAEALEGVPPEPPTSWLGAVLATYAAVEEVRGDRAHSEALLDRAATVWRQRGADKPLADALAHAGELMAHEEKWADVFRLYGEAKALHEKAGDTASLAKDLSRLGDVLVSAADTPGAKRHYEAARAAFEKIGDARGEAAQYRNLAIVARLDADPAGAAHMYRRAIELHRRSDDQPELASDLAALARTHLGMGEYDEAETLYDQANAIERQLGRSRALARNQNQLGNLHQLRGDLVAAEKMYRQALALSEAAADTTEAANNWANLAGVQHKRGHFAEAREMYERSLSLFERSGAKSKVLRVRGLLASLGRPLPAP
jgi:tetratricopeptide (TPR) repeat protein